jgi:quinol monooxygenase YgiN
MWAKWISCQVPPDARGRFGAAQAAWSVIGDQPGLVGQLGGWDPATGHARVLGLWADADAYTCFLRERHDAVFADSRQRDSYTAIEIATGEVLFEMPGEAADLPRALEGAALLRVADCRLLPDRAEHFLDVQRQVWAPGMAAAGGMLGGVVTQLEERRFLVASCWVDHGAHQQYATQRMPALRARAGLGGDVQSMTGHVLPLEGAWRVLPLAGVPHDGRI